VVAVDEEVVLLEEQLAIAHADIERLEARLVDADRRAGAAAELGVQLAALQAAAGEREATVEALQAQIAGLEGQISAAEAQSRAGAGRYRELVLAHEPDLPVELVFGESIAAIDEARQLARETVAKVRQHLEQQALAHRVPTGAPVRAAPDLANLSSAEKIRLGLQQS
jgi:hypothetical protein